MGIFYSPSAFYHIRKPDTSKLGEEYHFHDYYQVGYVERGVVTHCQEGNEAKLTHGDAFIIPPGFVHRVHFDGDTEMYSLSFLSNLFGTAYLDSSFYKFLIALSLDFSGKDKLDVKLSIALDEEQRRTAKSLFDCLLREFSSGYSQEYTAAAFIIASILCVIGQAYFNLPSSGSKLKQVEGYSQNILKCMKYIDQNFQQPLALEKMARDSGMSRSAFSFIFPRITGMTFRNYVNQRRIEHAAALARLPALTFYEIATMVGYNDFSTFFRNFTKIMGISPTVYRKKLGGE
jgi:AraC-like DNA-binding protein